METGNFCNLIVLLNHTKDYVISVMPQIQQSNIKSHTFSASINDSQFNYRILKMKDSVFIYIGEEGNETFDEIGMAMQTSKGEIISTTITGALLGCGSQELAEKLTKKLKKQIYVSCNVPVDGIVRPFIEKRLNEEIKGSNELF